MPHTEADRSRWKSSTHLPAYYHFFLFCFFWSGEEKKTCREIGKETKQQQQKKSRISIIQMVNGHDDEPVKFFVCQRNRKKIHMHNTHTHTIGPVVDYISGSKCSHFSLTLSGVVAEM